MTDYVKTVKEIRDNPVNKYRLLVPNHTFVTVLKRHDDETVTIKTPYGLYCVPNDFIEARAFADKK